MSKDNGNSWTKLNAPNNINWEKMSISADGLLMIGGSSNNGCYILTPTEGKEDPPCNTTFPSNVDNLERGKRWGTVEHDGNYKVSFKIHLRGRVGDWGQIFHLTQNDDNGIRCPAFWLFPNDTLLHIVVGDSADQNWWLTPQIMGASDNDMRIPDGQTSKIELTCIDKNITLKINNKVFRATQPNKRRAGKFTVFMSDPWYHPTNSSIKDFCFIPNYTGGSGGEVLEKMVSGCEGENARIVCSSGKKIKGLNYKYGKWEGNGKCGNNHADSNRTMNKYVEPGECVGKESCDMGLGNNWGDPWGGVRKQYEVTPVCK
jgi:hypothetical protein